MTGAEAVPVRGEATPASLVPMVGTPILGSAGKQKEVRVHIYLSRQLLSTGYSGVDRTLPAVPADMLNEV